jgi:hypothetical protein
MLRQRTSFDKKNTTHQVLWTQSVRRVGKSVCVLGKKKKEEERKRKEDRGKRKRGVDA